MTSEKLLSALSALIRQHGLPVYGIAAAVGRDDLGTVRCVPGNRCNNLYSVSKSFTALAVGILSDRGLLSMEDSVWSILHGSCPGMPQIWQSVTVHHVLTQTVGIDRGFLDVDVEDASRYPSRDYLKLVLERPLVHEPGRVFCYSDSNYYLASRLVHAACGEGLADFLRRELFVPLDFTAPAWAVCPQGHAMGATGLFCPVEDMLRFGMLCAAGGRWKDRQIVSEAWLRQASRPLADGRYGYSFRTEPGAAWYFCGGMLGQRIWIPADPAAPVVAWAAYDPAGTLAPLEDAVKRLYAAG